MGTATSLVLSSLLLTALGGCFPAPEVAVTIDGSRGFQTIEGFGTCLISWDPRMAEWYRRPEAVSTYTDYLGFTFLRTNLYGDGTISPKARPQDILHSDPEFARNDPRTPIFLDFGRRAKERQPGLKVIGTAWTPPAWMKVSGKITDTASGAIQATTYEVDRNGVKSEGINRVKSDHFPHVAAWLAEFARHYAKNGLPLYAISPANEPQFTQSFESCLWNATDLATVTALTREALNARGLQQIRIFGPETMTGFNWENGPNVQYTQAMRKNPAAFRALDIWATHGYEDGVVGDVSANSSAQFWNLIKGDDKPYWVTEGGTGGHDWPAPVSEKGVGLAIHNALVAGQASAFVPWQYAENARTEHNLMPLEGPSKKTHVVRHFSRFIPAMAQRVEATPAFGPLCVSAYVKGADLTVVLINPKKGDVQASVSLSGVPSVASLQGWVTSERQSSALIGAVAVKNGRASVTIPGPGIVTLTTVRLSDAQSQLAPGLKSE